MTRPPRRAAPKPRRRLVGLSIALGGTALLGGLGALSFGLSGVPADVPASANVPDRVDPPVVSLCDRAEAEGLGLLGAFFSTPLSVGAFVGATVLLWPFWRALGRGRTLARALAVGIVTLVLLGWFGVQFPVAVRLREGALTFPEAAAPDATLRALLGALLVGSALILPGLSFLLRVFKRETFTRP